MSQENVEIFKRGVEAWNGDDFDTSIALIDPEIEWLRSWRCFAGMPGSGSFGRASRPTRDSGFVRRHS